MKLENMMKGLIAEKRGLEYLKLALPLFTWGATQAWSKLDKCGVDAIGLVAGMARAYVQIKSSLTGAESADERNTSYNGLPIWTLVVPEEGNPEWYSGPKPENKGTETHKVKVLAKHFRTQYISPEGKLMIARKHN